MKVVKGLKPPNHCVEITPSYGMNLNFGDFIEDKRKSEQNCFETRRISHLSVRAINRRS